MNHAQVEAMLTTLCGAFGLKCPKHRIYQSSTYARGRYYPKRKTISIGLSSKQSARGGWATEDTVLHEFTHYLHHALEDFDCKYRDSHGPYFTGRLMEVAEFWYGEARKYPWHNEYVSVRKAYCKKTVL